MQTVYIGDNLHEMLNPIFWGKKKKKREKNPINLSSAKSAHGIVSVNYVISDASTKRLVIFFWHSN